MHIKKLNPMNVTRCRWIRRFPAFLVALSLVACSDSMPTGPEGAGTPSSVEGQVAQMTLTSLDQVVELEARALDASGTEVPGAALEWSSNSPDVLAHESGSTFRTVGNGTAVVTVGLDPAEYGEHAGAIQAQIHVTVNQEVAGVEILPTTSVLWAIGETRALRAHAVDASGHPLDGAFAVAWASDDDGVVEVTDAGEVVAVADGAATVTASLGDHSASVELEVEAGVHLSACIQLETPACTSLDLQVTVGG